MNYTTNYLFRKPISLDGTYVDDINFNMDLIDGNIKGISQGTGIATKSITYDKLGDDLLTKIIEGRNIFSQSVKITTGFYLDNTGTSLTSVTLGISDFVEIIPNQYYILPTHSSTPGCLYDASKTLISRINFTDAVTGSSSNPAIFQAPSNSKYIKVNVNTVDNLNVIYYATFMIVGGKIYPSQYINYGVTGIPWIMDVFPSVTPPLTNYAYNVDEGLRVYRSALAKFKVGLADISIQNVGDSVGEGYYTTNNTNGYVYRLRQKLLDLGYQNIGNGVMGLSDYRLATVSTGWTSVGGGAVISRGFNGSNVAQPLALNVVGKTFGYIYLKGTLGGTSTVQIDNETPVAIDYTGASSSINIIWIDSLTSGNHTFKINSPATNYTQAKGILCKTSLGAGFGFTLHNTSMSGTSSEDTLGTSTYRDLMLQSTFDYSSPNLTILELGLNDLQHGVTVATYMANLRQLADKALTKGSVLLLIMSPCTLTGYDVYSSAVYTVATEKNCAVLDINKAFGAYAISQPLGLFSDGTNTNNEGVNLHPSARGHQFIADLIAKNVL